MKFEILSGQFNSLEAPILWDNIPEFALIFGPNGAGKSHLLNSIRMATTANPSTQCKMVITPQFQQEEIMYIDTWDKLGAVVIRSDQIQAERAKLIKQLEDGNQRESRVRHWRERLAELSGKPFEQLGVEEIHELLPDEAVLAGDSAPHIAQSIAALFMSYLLKAGEKLLVHMGEESLHSVGGMEALTGSPAPWDVLNKLLQVAGFEHRIMKPEKFNVPYEFRVQNARTKCSVDLNLLSSGEKTLLTLGCMIFSAEQSGVKPSIILMDEPDRHLHSEMVRSFYTAVQEVIVKQLNIRVICASHRLEAIAVTPEESLFEIRPGAKVPDQIVAHPESKASALVGLASDVLMILPQIRTVFVEGSDDAEFYRVVWRWSRKLIEDNKLLPVFQDVKSGSQATTGGKNAVYMIMENLQTTPAKEVVCGIVDKDCGNMPELGVIVLPRYSIENYLYDPLTIYVYGLSAGIMMGATELTFPPQSVCATGSEKHLIDVKENTLQEIINLITSKVQSDIVAHLESQGKSKVVIDGLLETEEILLTNGKKFFYPKWQLYLPGKEVAQVYRKTFGNHINDKNMTMALDRMGVVHQDLLDLMRHVVKM